MTKISEEREREIKSEINGKLDVYALVWTKFYGVLKEDELEEYKIEVRDYNPCYDRVLVPVNSHEGFIGPMYDGDTITTNAGEVLKVMNRFETEACYERLSR